MEYFSSKNKSMHCRGEAEENDRVRGGETEAGGGEVKNLQRRMKVSPSMM